MFNEEGDKEGLLSWEGGINLHHRRILLVEETSEEL